MAEISLESPTASAVEKTGGVPLADRGALRVLYFAPKLFWPPNTGAKLRNYHLSKELARSEKLTYLGFSESHGEGPPPPDSCGRVVSVAGDHGYSLPNLVRGVVGRSPLTILKFVTKPMAAALERLLAEEEYDLVQIEGMHLYGYLPLLRKARGRPLVVNDWHNVESEVMQRYAEWTPGRLKRLYARETARRMAEAERQALRLLDGHVVVSQRDKEHLLSIAPEARVFVIENGVDVAHFTDDALEAAFARFRPAAPPLRSRVVFVGSMDYHANIDAAVHFVEHGWPALKAKRPELTFTLVGRSPPPEVRALARRAGVEVTGTVDDVRPYYREAVCALVPLRIGGGSRLKILEAMAAGVPVVSTRLGAEGIEAEDGVHLVLGETSGDLVRAAAALVGAPERGAQLAGAARELVRTKYDWSALGSSLLSAHRSLIDARNRVFRVLPG